MHFGNKNREHKYKMELGHGKQPYEIEKNLVERDLDSMVSLKWDNQVENAEAIIVEIRNIFDAQLVRRFHVSLVSSHLEFAVPVWNPYQTKKILGGWDLIQF